VWVVDDELHVRVGASARLHGMAPRIHRHDGISREGVDDLSTALLMASKCLSTSLATCALDSALHLGLITRSQAHSLLTTAKGRRIVELSDGRSESGIETLARLRLKSLGLHLRVQVRIQGVGRVDLLIGERLVIELDGDAWHSTRTQREEDRRRDSALVARGYLVMRAGYWRVLEDWKSFEREILTIVRLREHRWGGRRAKERHVVG
jgi:very-short-patch-repair endonuclease